jgi:predicted ATP-grasp superfamily ATP-dependent carboligase
MSVLITDGNERAALAVTRALGRQRLKVAVGAENEDSLAAASKYCWRSFSYPSPYADERGFVSRLLEVVKSLKISTVFPISEIAMSLVVRHRREFEAHTILPIPTTDAFESLSNKYRLMQLAAQLGVPIPETVFVPDGRWDRVFNGLLDFPVVVKPGVSVINIEGHRRKTQIHYAAGEAELGRLYKTIDYLSQPSLIQRRIEGEGQGVFALMDKGKPVSLFAHRRLREKPPSGGVSVLRESVALPQPMTDYALRLLQHVGWHGVAMVEFKVDRQSGAPLLMEVNGRFWGSLQLALDAGINFPCLLYRIAAGEELQLPVNGYRIGVKSRWLLGDLDHLLLRLLKSDEELSLPPNSPTKLKTLLEFCRFYQPGMRNEVLRFDDPKPFARELGRYVRDLLRPRQADTRLNN